MPKKLIAAGLFKEVVKLIEPDGTEHTVRAMYRSRAPVTLGQDGAVTEQVGIGEYVVRWSAALKDVSTSWQVEAFGNYETIDSVDSGNYRPGQYIYIRTTQQTKQVDD